MNHEGGRQGARIALAQLNFTVGAIEDNGERVIAAARRAREELDADLVVFPELALTGYPPEDLLLRPDFVGAAGCTLQRVAKAVQGIDVVVGVPRFQDGHLYNCGVVLRDGRVIGSYRKRELPNYSVFDEKRYFRSGNEPLVFSCRHVKFGVTICEDLWQPAAAHLARQAGAQILLNLNASPFHVGKADLRDQVIRERVDENDIPVVYVNLIGGQDELVFDGQSFAMDHRGEVVTRLGAFEESLGAVVFHENDLRAASEPAFAAPMSDVQSVYQAIVTGVRDYVGKNGFNGVVLGLSGGIDSALTLAIAVDALGPERVTAVQMPSRYTAQMSIEDATDQCQRLGVTGHILSIEAPFQAFLDTLAAVFHGLPADTTEENIQARCRGVLLMAISNKTGKLVLTTGNKSEMAVGYATLYGDMAGGFAPIKDVPKTLVYELARYRNRIEEVIPRRVLSRPPSAELAPGQCDQDALPPYEILDPILEMYIERDFSPSEIVAAGFPADTVRRVVGLVNRNEYKRRQAPPGVRISQRAFGRDRRYPITSGFVHENFP